MILELNPLKWGKHGQKEDKAHTLTPQELTLPSALKIAVKEQPATPVGASMSIASVLEGIPGDIKTFFSKVSAEVKQVHLVWTMIASPQTRSFLVSAGTDVLRFASDAESSIAAKGINFTLDSQVYADAKQLIADAKTGEGIIASDLKLLGVVFTTPIVATTPAPVPEA